MMTKEYNIDLPKAGVPTSTYGRIYPEETLRKAVEEFKGPAVCTFDGLTDDPSRASHIVESMRMDDDGNIIASIKILDTPAGALIKSIIENDKSMFTGLSSIGKLNDSVVEIQKIVGIGFYTGEVE